MVKCIKYTQQQKREIRIKISFLKYVFFVFHVLFLFLQNCTKVVSGEYFKNMKRVLFTIIISITATFIYGQNITGLWYAQPNVKTAHIRLALDIKKSNDNKFGIKLQSTDQSKEWMSVDNYEVKGSQITFSVNRLNLQTQCYLQSDSLLEGTLLYEGGQFPVRFTRTPIVYKRPQTPKPPFPYIREEVTFLNSDEQITLAGTLTLPKDRKPSKTVVLLSGSGAQDRNSEIFEHRPFEIIADYLARQGIATLRYDDRGVGQSQGNFATSSIPEFSTDAEAAITYLRTRPEITNKPIGIIGHSEGVAVAFTVAAQKKADFLISLAGGGVNGQELLLMQRAALLKASGADSTFIEEYNHYMRKAQEVALQTGTREACEKRLIDVFKGSSLAGSEKAIATQLHTPTMLGMLSYNPEWDYPEIDIPVLALNGTKDRQVTVENLKYIQKGLLENGNKKVTVKEFPNLNHFFQTANTGLPNEYALIEESFNTEVLKTIADWIKQL